MNSPREQSGGGEDVDVCLRRRREHPEQNGVRLYERNPRRGGAYHSLWIRRRELERSADEHRRPEPDGGRDRQPPERRHVDVHMAARPPARGDEQVRDEYHLRLRFRRQAHLEDRGWHCVQLPLSGRPAGRVDMGRK